MAGVGRSSSWWLGERITTPGLGERITTPGVEEDLSFWLGERITTPGAVADGVPSATRGACSLSGGGGGGGDDDGELGASELLEDLARRRILVPGLRDLFLSLGCTVSFRWSWDDATRGLMWRTDWLVCPPRSSRLLPSVALVGLYGLDLVDVGGCLLDGVFSGDGDA